MNMLIPKIRLLPPSIYSLKNGPRFQVWHSHNYIVPLFSNNSTFSATAILEHGSGSYVNIEEIDKYRNIHEFCKTSDAVVDKCARLAIEGNIKINKVSLNATRYKFSSLTKNKKYTKKILPGLRVNSFTSFENKVIKENFDKLSKVEELKTEEKVKIYEKLFSYDGEHSKEKEEIIGHFLSQGFIEPRHPVEVFRQFQKLNLIEAEEETLFPEDGSMMEDHIIDTNSREAEKKNKSNEEVKTYYTKGPFTVEESKKILMKVYENNPYFMENADVSPGVLEEEGLAVELDRAPQDLAQHWSKVILPLLTRLEAGVLEVDFRRRLLKHCVKNDIRYAQEADWEVISRLPEFKGTTPAYLSILYARVKSSYKFVAKKEGNKGKSVDVNSKVLHDFLETCAKNAKHINKREEDLLQFYQSLTGSPTKINFKKKPSTTNIKDLQLQEPKFHVPDEASLIKIKDIQKYRDTYYYSCNSDYDSLLDHCVKMAYIDNMKVRDVSYYSTRCDWTTAKYDADSRYPGLKANYFTNLEESIIMENAERLKNKTINNYPSEVDGDGDFFEQLFQGCETGQREKEEIVGYFLSRGLEAPRHPGEVFNQLKSMTMFTKGSYTEEEDKNIMKVVNEHGQNKESWNILEPILNRKAKSISDHWYRTLHPLLTRHGAGVLYTDFTFELLTYCVENKIKYSEDANWHMIASLPQFHGTTPAFLSNIYSRVKVHYECIENKRNNINKVQKKPNGRFQHTETTSEMLLNYIEMRGEGMKTITKRDGELIMFWDKLTQGNFSSIDKGESLINIQDVKKYHNIPMSKSNVLDQCVKMAFEDNIRIYKVSLDATKYKPAVFNKDSRYRKLLPGVKSNYFNALENKTMNKNTDKLIMRLSGRLKIKEEFKQDIIDKLFSYQDEEHAIKVKEEIVGFILSQGLKEPRHPGEVFNEMRKVVNDKRPYTEAEDELILDEVDKNGPEASSFKILERNLQRDRKSIANHYRLKLKHRNKTNVGQFSLEETKMILQTVYDRDPNFLQCKGSYDSVTVLEDGLSVEMNRPPGRISHHWHSYVRPLLSRHDVGVLNVDFKLRLLEYCVENNIKYAQDANWEDIAKLPEFHGTTATYLSVLYAQARGSCKKYREKLSGFKIEDIDLTSETTLEYLKTRVGSGMRPISRKDQEIISFYETLKKERSRRYELALKE